MKTKQLKKGFDAVKTMRAIRDKFSKEIMNMSFEEEKDYLKKLLAKDVKKVSESRVNKVARKNHKINRRSTHKRAAV